MSDVSIERELILIERELIERSDPVTPVIFPPSLFAIVVQCEG
ncbi:MAG TPA: hypothetical protein VK699_00395 [Terriglobales bacterium]|nr:hypothetical protein [Terriglobales bacterium]